MTRSLLVSFAIALFLAGCGERTSGEAAGLPPSAEPGVAPRPEARPDSIASGFVVRGLYLGTAFDSAAVVVSHEAIPGFMSAMRMQLRVADRADLRGLREGDKIRFRLADPDGDGYRVSMIETLPPDTPLALADTTEEAVPPESSLPNLPTPPPLPEQ